MATIKDGIKIGFGLLLFKWLLGLGGCVTMLGVGSCLLCNLSENRSHAPSVIPSAEKPVGQASPETSVEKRVSFSTTCIIRSGRGLRGKILGKTAPRKSYVVLEHVRWVWFKIRAGKVEGWVGCTPMKE